jgi:hypothetical protein
MCTMVGRALPPSNPKRVHVRWLCVSLVAAVVAGTSLWTSWHGNAERPPTTDGRPTNTSRSNIRAEHTPAPGESPDESCVRHVWPGAEIQDALELAAKDSVHKIVRVHAGTYRPLQHAQAMIYLNARHEGITLEADGEVILTAANPEIADATLESFPAIVNHVVYLGDGLSRKTVLRGFKITGAKNFLARNDNPICIEAESEAPPLRTKKWTYYADGGGIKIWGRSSPWIDRVEIYENYAYPCAAAISVENRGYVDEVPLITNSIFHDNRTRWTGSAIDLFGPGNAAEIRNCLFVGNVSNRGVITLTFPEYGFHEENGSGALTVFPDSRVWVDRCTFTGNYNGVDDESDDSMYTNCIFWKNDLRGGISPGKRYEMDIRNGTNVRNCWLGGGTVSDLRGKLSATSNVLGAPDPEFDEEYRPSNSKFADVGYRPVDR